MIYLPLQLVYRGIFTKTVFLNVRMGEREAGAALRGHQAPDHEGSGVREEDFSLESLDMLRVIGTGTFARVCLCQVRR